MSNPSVTKNVAPNLYFLSSGRATVKCDLLASSNVSTTSLSGIGSGGVPRDPTPTRRGDPDNIMPAPCQQALEGLDVHDDRLMRGLRRAGSSPDAEAAQQSLTGETTR